VALGIYIILLNILVTMVVLAGCVTFIIIGVMYGTDVFY